MRDVEVRWARLNGKAIAYAVFGAGPFDMLFGQIWCPIDLLWELPQLASFMDALGSMARVIMFDGSASVHQTRSGTLRPRARRPTQI